MYNVLVVDDEPIVRLALKSLVSWESYGFSLDLEAASGKQALKLIMENPKIDLIITDINMPIMDGLQLISELNKLSLTIPVIILSAYNDYNLVRQAFKLGAKDYILKTEINPENILQMLKNMVIKENLKDTSMDKDNKGKNNEYIKYLKNEYLRTLIEPNSDTKMDYSMDEMGIKLPGGNFVVCFFWVDNYNEVLKRYSSNTLSSFVKSIANSISQVLSDINMGEVITVSPQEYVVLLSFQNISYADINSKTNDILQRIRHSLSTYINISVTVGVSDIKDGIGNVGSLYKQAEKNARLRFIYGKGKTIFTRTPNLKIDSKDNGISEIEKKFSLALNELDMEAALKEIDVFIAVMQKANYTNIKKFHSEYMKIIFMINNSLNEMGENILDLFPEEIDFYDRITKFETLEELNIWIKGIIAAIFKYLIENKKIRINKTISRALEFIKQNFNNSEFNLKMASDYVELSENHFSTLFTKEVGETFTGYLTNIRIEKAKQLINKTNLKVYEICEKVGYTNVEYFSRVFKKVTGVSPNAFKNM